MKVLVVNCVSSSLKFRLSETPSEPSGRKDWSAWGVVDGVGGRATLDFSAKNGTAPREPAGVADHGEAVGQMLRWLGEVGNVGDIEAVGHRVVNGGDRFAGPVLVDDEVVASIEELEELTPLHKAPSLAAIRATREALGAGASMVATFDTTF